MRTSPGAEPSLPGGAESGATNPREDLTSVRRGWEGNRRLGLVRYQHVEGSKGAWGPEGYVLDSLWPSTGTLPLEDGARARQFHPQLIGAVMGLLCWASKMADSMKWEFAAGQKQKHGS